MRINCKSSFFVYLLIISLVSCNSDYSNFDNLEFSITSGSQDFGYKKLILSSDSIHVIYLPNSEDSCSYSILINDSERKLIAETISYHMNPKHFSKYKLAKERKKELIFKIVRFDTKNSQINSDDSNEITSEFRYLNSFSDISPVYCKLIKRLKKEHRTEFKDW